MTVSVYDAGVPDVEHTFSVEIASKDHVKTLSLSNEAHGQVLFEGNLGTLRELNLVEGDVLVVVGTYGVLRLGLTAEQLQTALRHHRRTADQGSEVGSHRNTNNNRRE